MAPDLVGSARETEEMHEQKLPRERNRALFGAHGAVNSKGD